MIFLIERILSITIMGMGIWGGLVGEITVYEAVELVVLGNIWGAIIDIRISADRGQPI